MRLYQVRYEEFPYMVCPDRGEETVFSIELNKHIRDDEFDSIEEFMLRSDIRIWLDAKFGPDYYEYDGLDGTLAFQEAKDLMLFKLKWLASCQCTAMETVNSLDQTYVDF